ncbi:hypothetical protein GCM10009117_14100 [Gangjinia marincola]|uniref:Uncharacterized protein n=1 Tax=Gangjinia marincola TaxID=578463 RepID=A0ABN1MGH5_9FLAO
MITKVRYNLVVFVILALVSCRKKKSPIVVDQLTTEIKLNQDSSTSSKWHYRETYPIGERDISANGLKKNPYENIVFQLNQNGIRINEDSTEEIFRTKLPIKIYFNAYMKQFYINLFQDKLKISLPDSIISIRNKNAHIKASPLKSLFDDAFIVKNYFIIEQDGFAHIFSNQIISDEKSKIAIPPAFDEIVNKELVGISILNESNSDPYKKYGLDFETLCYCNTPSLLINKDDGNLIVFNYCDKESVPENSERIHILKIIEAKKMKASLYLKTESNVELYINKKTGIPIYQIIIDGPFPKEYVGNTIKENFTPEPEKFEKVSCKDFDG